MGRRWFLCLGLCLITWRLHRGFAGVLQLGAASRGAWRTVLRVRERKVNRAPRQGGARSGKASGQTDPRVITKRISQLASASEVLAVVKQEQRNPKLNLICISAAWAKIAKMPRSLADVRHDPFFPAFVLLTEEWAQKAGAEPKFYARAVANTLWAVSKLYAFVPLRLASLQKQLSIAVPKTAEYMQAQEIANIIWASTKLSDSGDDSLLAVLPALRGRVQEVKQDMNAQHVANIMWASAKLSDSGDDSLLALLPVLSGRFQEVKQDMNAQAVANIIWASAKLAQEVKQDMDAQNVANIIWAGAKLSDSGDDSLLILLPTLAVRAKEVRSQMKPQAIHMISSAAKQLLNTLTDTDMLEACQTTGKGAEASCNAVVAKGVGSARRKSAPLADYECVDKATLEPQVDRPIREVLQEHPGKDGWCVYGAVGDWISMCAKAREARDYRIFGDYIASNEEFLHLPAKRYTYVLPDGAKVTSRDFLYPLDDIYCLVNGWYDLPRDKAANDREYVERMSRKTCQQLQAEVPNFENLSFQEICW
ncbi:unnamed protein product [Effrenium voratum]|nr:unnamed protein product [Effrenium voratum]